LHKTGHKSLSVKELRQLIQTLGAHHSQDHQFLRSINRAMTNVPWFCQCGRKNRKNAWYCGDCQASWTFGTPDYGQQQVRPQSPRRQQSTQAYSQWQWPQEPWTGNAGAAHQGRAQSPRQNAGGPRRKSRKGKKAAQQTLQQAAPPFVQQPPLPPPTTPPPAMGSAKAPSAPTMTPGVPATSAASTIAPPPEEIVKYRALVQKLQKHQDQGVELPDDIQVDLKDAIAKVAKHNKKTMHQAVNAMDNARQDYDKAVQARAQLHSQWRSFLADSLKLWQGHTASFQTQEAQLTEKIQQAKEAFVVARDIMNASKIEAASMVPVEETNKTVEVSDEEELKDVPMAAAQRIATGLTSLVETMSQLQAQTDELVQEEQRAKRPRVNSSTPADRTEELADGITSSLPSFGGPGGQ